VVNIGAPRTLSYVNDQRRQALEQKVYAGERLTRADGAQLYEAGDLSWLGRLAQHVRAEKNGDRAFFTAGPVPEERRSTVATMRYGNLEERPARLEDLLRLRELQEETNAFVVFVPLPAPSTVVAPVESLRTFAVSRLMLDNVVHIGCDRAAHGAALAQLALHFGADDLGGYEHPEQRDDLLHLIWDAGLRPVERDAAHAVIREHTPAPPLAQRRAEPQQVWS
jgi:2-iminoacetate synthase ThiH